MVSLPTILLILAGVSIGAAVIAALIAFRSAREARSAIFPIVREEETLRAQRARIATFMLSALTALFLGGWLATLRLGAPPPDDNVVAAVPPVESPAITFVTETAIIVTAPPVVAATPTLAQQVQAVPTTTPLPPATLPPISTPEAAVEASVGPATAAQPAPTQPLPPSPTLPPPTATPVPPTAVSTDTPAPTPTATVIVALPTSGPRTPAPPGVRMGPIQFAADITPNIEPINPGDFFPQNTESVYAVYPYSGMVDGVDFAAVWYQNGVELWRDEQKWRWGDNAQFYSFLNPPGDGLYKLELYVNDSVVATGIFEIR